MLAAALVLIVLPASILALAVVVWYVTGRTDRGERG